MTTRLLSLLVLALIMCTTAMSQAPTLTTDEARAAERIKLNYNRRMSETGRVDDLIADMFVSDVSTRWLQETREARRATLPVINKDAPGYLAGGLISYSAQLPEKISPEDWKGLNAASINWVRAIVVAMVNRLADIKASGKDLDDLDDEAEISKFFPPSVKALFAGDSTVSMDSDKPEKPIETIDEARRVTSLVNQARALYLKEFGDRAQRYTPLALKALATPPKNASDFATTVEVSNREMYGFPSGTRFVKVYASPAEKIVFVKQEKDYKIVDVVLEISD